MAQEYLRKVEYLASLQVGPESYPGWDSKRLLARFHSLMHNTQAARNVVRHHVKAGLDLLSDEDEENDWQGYITLAVTLTPIDDTHALAAWSLLAPIEYTTQISVVEKADHEADHEEVDLGAQELALSTDVDTHGPEGKTKASIVTTTEVDIPAENDTKTLKESSITEPTTVSQEGHLGNCCDGECGTEWPFADDMYYCKDCPDVQFDERCLAKLRAGTLGKKVCNPSHEFLYIPKWDKEAQKHIPKGSVRVGSDVLTMKEWLDRIRKEWGFAI